MCRCLPARRLAQSSRAGAPPLTLRPKLSNAASSKQYPKPPKTAGAKDAGPRIVDQYELQEQLHVSESSGTEVYLSKHRATGELVAVKAVRHDPA